MHSEEGGLFLFVGSGGCGGVGMQMWAQVKRLAVGLYNAIMFENTMGFFEK